MEATGCVWENCLGMYPKHKHCPDEKKENPSSLFYTDGDMWALTSSLYNTSVPFLAEHLENQSLNLALPLFFIFYQLPQRLQGVATAEMSQAKWSFTFYIDYLAI